MNVAAAVSASDVQRPTDSGIYVTIHGHFYQPPRENPYLNAIERQESAAPFHDWNARIHHECYRPNAFSRIERHDGKIVKIVNNYEYMSFNMGPTLLSWMEFHDRDTYQAIIDADKRSADRLNGHGNAIAQVYNHIIMPLANWRDKLTQIRWGKADFVSRFGREPEGMWLAETAVDYETLEALALEGIKFIVLAPSQAQRCRLIPTENNPNPSWQEVGGAQIDPNRAYRCHLRRHNSISSNVSELGQFHLPANTDAYIDMFFYDGPISRDMGFGDLLGSSHNFAKRLAQAVRNDQRPHQVVSVATDGETFGHHKHFTEKTLSYAFVEEFPKRGWTVTNYAHYLSLFPPTWEVELKSVTAWSCAHGVDRWQGGCGCGGEGSGYQLLWRRPLRDSLNWLRDRLATVYIDIGRKYFNDPWEARDRYIEVLQYSLRDGIAENSPILEKFFEQQCGDKVSTSAQRIDALRLLEMQRHALLMFTSCGWFFEELSRPETVQILRYAARAIELAADVAGVLLEDEFIKRMAKSPSNLAEFKDGAGLYREQVVTNRITLAQVAAQYALSSTLGNYAKSQQIYCYQIQQQDYQLQRIGSMSLAIGQINLVSGITQESVIYIFAVLHLGGDDFHCCIQPFTGRREYEEIKATLFKVLKQANTAAVILEMANNFSGEQFNLHHLFAEERHKILRMLADETLTRLDQLYEQVYRDNYGILISFRRDDLPVPRELQVAADIVLNNRLTEELERLETGATLPNVGLDAVAMEAINLGCKFTHIEDAEILENYILKQIKDLSSNPNLDEKILFNYLNQIEEALIISDRLNLKLNLNLSQEAFLNYLSAKIAPQCILGRQILDLETVEKQPIHIEANLCENISNLELHQLIDTASKLGIATEAWLKG
ncbi:MAG: glycoside hydrolase [Pseudanabaena sp.]|nr:MAG: glycoside hydrolase [Pseudanabaena sp.]